MLILVNEVFFRDAARDPRMQLGILKASRGLRKSVAKCKCFIFALCSNWIMNLLGADKKKHEMEKPFFEDFHMQRVGANYK